MIGWLFVIGIIGLIILYKFLRKSQRKIRPLCPVCGEEVVEVCIHDKSTGEYYHPGHWLEYTKQEIFNEIKGN